MMGIPISGASYIYGDNMSVVHNNSVYYYAVCELAAMDKSLLGHIPSRENVANLMTKVLYWWRQNYLVSNILYDIDNEY